MKWPHRDCALITFLKHSGDLSPMYYFYNEKKANCNVPFFKAG